MPKVLSQFVCQSCGASSAKWSGRCLVCSAWDSMVETEVSGPKSLAKGQILETAPLKSLASLAMGRLDTGDAEVNQVLGGGVVPGSVILLSGDPGIGKSTLTLQLADNLAKTARILYVSGEESNGQIKLRAQRLGAKNDLDLATETDIETVAAAVSGGNYKVVVIDSIQTMYCPQLTGNAGSVGQITACAQLVQQAAKSSGTAVIMIGHVTKDGQVAGPKVLEHLVDVVLYLEGDRYGSFKALRGIKNRFGSTHEVGIFEMTERGLAAVTNPSQALLAQRQAGPGSVVLAAMEGSRPVLVEVQALVSPSLFGYPKRTAVGFDLNRLNLLVAVLQKRAGMNLNNQDIYVNIVGGLKVTEPAADLAIILSIASAFKNCQVLSKHTVFGEVGLGGEIRSVGQVGKRLAEAKKLGFIAAFGPSANGPAAGLKGVSTLSQALQTAFESVK